MAARALEHADADAAIHLIVEAEAWHVGQNVLAGGGAPWKALNGFFERLHLPLDMNS